ncbi:hypothetical protein [Acidovorax sp. NCPPB 3576]|nr:hypothetical protein [Acidovorax sp. NCPPB 3576]WCM87236.1 hypothetical protein M5C98_17990 [Acidovorax sp. NCPPB 3576]
MPRSTANAIRRAEQGAVPDAFAHREAPCPFDEREPSRHRPLAATA